MKKHRHLRTNLLATLAWGLGSAFVFFQFVLQASPSVMQHHLMHTFHLTAAGLGNLSASFYYTYIVLQIPAGILIDKWGARRVMFIGLCVTSLATGLFAVSTNVYESALSRIVMGIFCAPTFVATLYLAANWFSAERFALFAGLTEALGMLGGAAGQELLAAAVVHYGWRQAMLGCMVLGFLIMAAIYFYCYDGPAEDVITPKPTNRLKEGAWRALIEVAQIPQVWINNLIGGLTFGLITAFASLWAVPYLSTLYHLDTEAAAFMSSMIFLGTATGAPSFAWFSNKIERRKLPMLIGAILSFAISLAILYCPPSNPTLMYLILFVYGFSCSIYMLPFAVVKEITRREIKGTALGFTNMVCGGIGALILLPLVGVLLDRYKMANALSLSDTVFTVPQFQQALLVFPLCLGVSLLLVLFVEETYCREVRDEEWAE